MNKAFVREPDQTDDFCPRCGSKGEPVGSETLEAYLSDEQMGMVSESANFCPSPQCRVVYFDAFERAICTDEIERPVYPKDPTAPVCTCLGLTQEDIEQDVRDGVKTRVKAAVAQAGSPDACCHKTAANGRPCITYVQRYYLRCLEDGK
ncbi:MAG: hypothetical protein U9N87_05735 [Planctomycetota bacterium]|nr:hypothetical protein [Planctomycetota bacterium]